MSQNFTPAAQRAITAASQWRRIDAQWSDIKEVQLLLGLLSDRECRAALLLAERGVHAEAALLKWPLRREDVQIAASPLLAEAASRLVSEACERLWELPRPLQIGTEHLLLALVLDPGEVGQLLRERGFAATQLEQQIYALHHVTPGPVSVDEDLSPRPKSSSIDTHAPLRAIASSQQIATLRIVDAAANRAAEGLRVIEDFLRFALEDGHLTRLIKQLRHDLTQSLALFSTEDRIAARETAADVGTAISASREYLRRDFTDVVAANFARVEQSLRSLEEFSKLRHPAAGQRFEQLRYRTYTLERAVQTTAACAARLADARLYVLVDGRQSLVEFRSLCQALVSAGVHVLQLRDKQLSDCDLLTRAKALREITANSPTLFIMNDRPDLAILSQADGVHVGQDELAVSEVRKLVGPVMLIGVSTHNITKARRAVLDGASYIGVGPTFASATKQFDQLAGIEFIRQVAAEISLPAFAIGGIDVENIAQVITAGVRRVAVSGAIIGSADPVATARSMMLTLAGTQH